MSEPENFIARWSRRKREAAEDAEAMKSSAVPDAAAESVHPIPDQREGSDAPRARSGASEPPEFAPDPAKLPPIETITAETDIRAFLAPGVPPELTRAALRRAWAADPKIRDFVGLADLSTQQVQSNAGTSQNERTGAQNEPRNSEALPQRSKEDIALQNNPKNPDNDQLIGKRPHGHALPK